VTKKLKRKNQSNLEIDYNKVELLKGLGVKDSLFNPKKYENYYQKLDTYYSTNNDDDDEKDKEAKEKYNKINSIISV
jgi:hypothetical protein